MNKSELTAEKFVPHPFKEGSRIYRTGDFVRFKDNGIIEFIGREDNQVKVRGYRIELSEIETLLNQHSLVKDSVVVIDKNMQSNIGSEKIIAFIMLNLNSGASDNILKDYVKSKLPNYMWPSHYIYLEKIPLTLNGKVDRKELLKQAAANQKFENIEHVVPKDHYEEMVLSICSSL
jgi:acyl-coenzyme A synthetase/AMP-(fatty) acid ligase